MKRFLKSEKGVNLISLTVSIVVIIILTSIVLNSLSDNIGINKIKNMEADIQNLRDKISYFYSNYGEIPAKREYTNIDMIQVSNLISDAVDTGKFYVIDLSAIENLTLSYGQDYKKITEDMTDDELNKLEDLYIINKASHNIFYVKGIKYDGQMFHTDYNSEEVKNEQVKLRYVDNVKIPEGYTYISGDKETGIKIKNDSTSKTYTWIVVQERIADVPTGITAESVTDGEFIESVNIFKGYYKSDENTAISMTATENWSPVYDKTSKYVDKNGDSAYIPKGFKVSRKIGENIIQEGLVVSDENGNEFVWVPVEDIDTMSQCETAGGNCNLELVNGQLKCITPGHSSTAENIVGKLYETTMGESFGTLNTNYDASSGFREPGLLTSYDTTSTYYTAAGYTSSDSMLTGFKSEYKQMATSVAKYGGFYVARYETSLTSATASSAGTSGTVQSKASVIPTGENNTVTNMWYGLYKAQKGLTNENVTSSMIWGSQYDALLNWAKNGNDVTKITTKGIGNNSSGSIKTTGNLGYRDDTINNIRDLGGNLREFTLTAYDTSDRAIRGGYYNASYSPSYVYYSAPYSTSYAYNGSRMALYIN